jgi:hypothetical protein
MSTARLPRAASWLLRRLACGPQRESLIGDLDEQFASRVQPHRVLRYHSSRQRVRRIGVRLGTGRHLSRAAAPGVRNAGDCARVARSGDDTRGHEP